MDRHFFPLGVVFFCNAPVRRILIPLLPVELPGWEIEVVELICRATLYI